MLLKEILTAIKLSSKLLISLYLQSMASRTEIVYCFLVHISLSHILCLIVPFQVIIYRKITANGEGGSVGSGVTLEPESC